MEFNTKQKVKKGDYNYEKWVSIVDFVGVTDQDKRDWLINFLQGLEDNGNIQMATKFNDDKSVE